MDNIWIGANFLFRIRQDNRPIMPLSWRKREEIELLGQWRGETLNNVVADFLGIGLVSNVAPEKELYEKSGWDHHSSPESYRKF